MEKVSSLRILEGEPSKESSDEVEALILPNIFRWWSSVRFGAGWFGSGTRRGEREE